MLRLALSERSDCRLRSIRFNTELTSPALCALADYGALTKKPAVKTAKSMKGETILLINNSYNFFANLPFQTDPLVKPGNYKV